MTGRVRDGKPAPPVADSLDLLEFPKVAAERSVWTMGRLRDVRDFERIVLAYREGSVVTIGDLARVTDSNEEVRSQTRLWEASMGKDAPGENAISLSIRKQSGTNTVEVVDRVMARLDRIKETLPTDISVKTTRDQSRFIRKSFSEIQHHLLLGGLFAAVVVFFASEPRPSVVRLAETVYEVHRPQRKQLERFHLDGPELARGLFAAVGGLSLTASTGLGSPVPGPYTSVSPGMS